MRAAGRTLTVGELREAIAGLPDNAKVTAHARYVYFADAGATSVDLDPDDILPTEEIQAEIQDIIREMASGGPIKDIRVRARDMCEEYGW